jgi:hypothetical protein
MAPRKPDPFKQALAERDEAIAERDQLLQAVGRLRREHQKHERRMSELETRQDEVSQMAQERDEEADRASRDADFEQALTRFYGDEQWRRMDLPVDQRKASLLAKVAQLQQAFPNLSQRQIVEGMQRGEVAYAQRRRNGS